MDTIDGILDHIRDKALDQRAKGTTFENLIQKWLMIDPEQSRRFNRVQTNAEWKAEQGRNRKDTGMDLVGTLKNGSGFVVI